MNQILTGQFIKQCRKEKGLTQEQLAERLNISCKTVSKWECGKGLPEISLMLPLCNELGITVNELLSGCKISESQYKEKAEENLISAVAERRENKKKLVLQILIAFSTVLSGCVMFLIAGALQMPLAARVGLIVAGAVVAALGIGGCCVMDRETGYYECPACKELFVPTMAAYVAGAHTLTRRRLKCPHCKKVNFCKKKLGK